MSTALFLLAVAAAAALLLPGVVFMERETDRQDWTVLGWCDCDGAFSWRVSFSRRGFGGIRFRWNAFRLRFEDGSVSVLSCPLGALGLCLHDRETSA